MHTIFWVEILKGKRHFEDLGVDVRSNIEMGPKDIGCRLDSSASRQRPVNTVMNHLVL
jgi:hypothetical protein